MQENHRLGTARLARGSLIAVITGGATLGLSACAQSGPEPLEDSYKVGQVSLEVDLAETRQNVRELCNTGEGADQMRQDWADYGYEERSGMDWIDAFTYVADLQYMDDPTAIATQGSFTYPTIEYLAENCVEAAFLAAQVASDIYTPESAAPLLEEFRTADESDTVIPLERVFNTIRASQ